jgi:hypothetical protein
MSNQPRLNILMVFTALVVSYVRSKVAGYSLLSSWELFFGNWIIHYFALLFVLLFSGIVDASLRKHILGAEKKVDFSDPELPYQVTVTVLVIAMGFLLLRFWPASDVDF